MKLLVIQEQHFTKLPNGEVWVDKQSDRKFWDRYLNIFDEIVVCARLREENQIGNKALRSDRNRVTFIGLPDFRGASGIVKHFFEINKTLKKALSDVDCVIFRAPSPISMVCYGPVKRSGKVFAVELMNNPFTHFSKNSMHHFYQPLIQHFITWQTKDMCLCANGVSYVTENVLQKLYPSRAAVNGESVLFFESSYSTINLTSENYKVMEWPSTRPSTITLVHSGEMLDYRKGQDILIKLVEKICKEGFSCRCILIGDGSVRKEFEKLACELNVQEKVDFVGWKSGFENVQKELHKGHFFIFPSTGEGLPRSIIEAMASGLLCFGSNVDGISELLDEDTLVNDFNETAFYEKIKPFLLDWNKCIEKRKIQHQKSKEYQSDILTARRNVFYSKIKNAVINKAKGI